jgi:hypothetical protein
MLVGVAVVTVAIMTTVATLSTRQAQGVDAQLATEKTFFAAEAGLNQAMYKLAVDPATANFATTVDNVSVSVVITAAGFQRIITATAADASGKVRTLQVTVNAPGFGGGFANAVQSGDGGVVMENNSAVIGDLYSNGTVTGGGQATVQGNVTVASNVVNDQQDVSNTGEFNFGRPLSSTSYDVAQRFTVGSTAGTPGTLSRVSVLLRKQGNPAIHSLLWRITSDSGGIPTTDLRHGFMDDSGVSTITNSFAWVNINLPTPLPVSAGQKLWLLLDAPTTASNDYWVWAMDSNDSYNGAGDFGASSSANWSNAGVVWTNLEADGADFAFKTWLGGVNTRLENITVWKSVAANRVTGTGSGYAKVCGDAYYDTISDSSADFLNSSTAPSSSSCPSPWTAGAGYPGSTDQPFRPLPINDTVITQWENDVSTTNTPPTPGSCPSGYTGWYCIMSNTTLGNVKINNSVYVDGAVTITLTGNVWVTGSIVFANAGAGKLQAASSLGAASVVLVVNGTISISNNYGFQGSGDPKSFVIIATSSNATPAITADNGSASLLLAAPNGQVDVMQNGTLNAAIGKTLHLFNNSTVTYNSNLASLFVPSTTPAPLTAVGNSWIEQ